MFTPTVYEDMIRESLEAWARCVLKDLTTRTLLYWSTVWPGTWRRLSAGKAPGLSLNGFPADGKPEREATGGNWKRGKTRDGSRRCCGTNTVTTVL